MLFWSAFWTTRLSSAAPNHSVLNSVQIVASWLALNANTMMMTIGR